MADLFHRVSIRKYQEKKVEPEKLDYILRASMAAPSACTRSVSDSFLPLCTGHIAAIIISTLTGTFNCKKAIDITFCLLYDNHDK